MSGNSSIPPNPEKCKELDLYLSVLIQPGLLDITERGVTESKETEDKGLESKDGHSWKN